MLQIIREKLANFIAPEMVERRNYFERLANTDALTGLANRFAFDKAKPAADADARLFYIIFDFNNFKLANKKISHKKGDEILVRYAAVIGNVARRFNARAFRLGGDEFVIICHRHFAGKVRDAVEQRALPLDFGDFEVSVSGETGHTLESADALLQARKAKRKGM